MDTKTNESANVQNAQVTNPSETEVVANTDAATATVKVTSANFVPGDPTATESYRQRDGVVVNFSEPVIGHALDTNGVRVRKEVTNVWLDPKLFVALCLNADDRLAVVIGNKPKIPWLTTALVNANVTVTRELVVLDDVEHYNTKFDKIEFTKSIEAGIRRGFDAFFMP